MGIAPERIRLRALAVPSASNRNRFAQLYQAAQHGAIALHYHPALGRFHKRDPIGYEARDVNLLRYVRNAPIVAKDPGGTDLVGTEVFYCIGYQKGALVVGGPLLPIHWFMKIDGIGYGKFESDLNSVGTGELRKDDHLTYPERSAANTPDGEFYSVCYEILIDDECYNVDEFKRFARDFYRYPPGIYVAGNWDCKRWVRDAVSHGKEMSKERKSGWSSFCHCLNVYWEEDLLPDLYDIDEPNEPDEPSPPTDSKPWWEYGPGPDEVYEYL